LLPQAVVGQVAGGRFLFFALSVRVVRGMLGDIR
jgi:hypothetical protein